MGDGITDEDKKAFALAGGKVSTPTESLKLKDTFVAWMDQMDGAKNLRQLCDEGKADFNGRETFPKTLWITWLDWPMPISRLTWARSFTISICPATICSKICPRVIT